MPSFRAAFIQTFSSSPSTAKAERRKNVDGGQDDGQDRREDVEEEEDELAFLRRLALNNNNMASQTLTIGEKRESGTTPGASAMFGPPCGHPILWAAILALDRPGFLTLFLRRPVVIRNKKK
jgi:hypothetical protein